MNMRRRQYLRYSTIGIATIAGCTGGQGGSSGQTDSPKPTESPTPTPSLTPSPTPTPTDSPTPSPTPEPPAPNIEFVNLVSSWESFGDARDNKITEAAQGDTILIAARYESWVHDGTSDETIQMEIYDSAGNRVAFQQDTSDQIVDQEGLTEWEWYLSFEADWEPGEYTAEVAVRDDVTGKVSKTESTTFTITKPEPKVEILSHQWFEETYSEGVKGTAQNVSDQTLDYVEVKVVFLDDQGTQLESSYDNTTDLAAGRKWKFEVQYYGDEEVADYEISASWSIY